jgi:superfamily I DNA and/or RNA helicase
MPQLELDAALERWRELLRLEEEEGRAAEDEKWATMSARALEEEGRLARRLALRDRAPALFGRLRLDLGADPTRPGHLAAFGARAGDVVRVTPAGGGAEASSSVSGVVLRASRDRISVVLDASGEDAGELEDAERIDLRLARDEVTMRRLVDGLSAVGRSQRGPSAALLGVLLGVRDPQPSRTESLALLDQALNEDQRRAVEIAAGVKEVALVHGPFGTGKTRVLVEVVRQAVQGGLRVLCLAASNAAVDHLAISLLEADPELRLSRTGHPARVDARLEAHTLAALTEAHERRKLARGLVEQALQLLRSTERRSERGPRAVRRDADRAARAEARGLFADARKLERQAAAEVLEKSRVLAGTLTGFATELGAEERFDLAVVDEASQALTPALLLAALRADRMILAGDHRQLPPTVVSPKAAARGLAGTAFEALMERPDAIGFGHLLTVQHRMHEDLMRFPSEHFYGGRLVAHAGVARRTLSEGEVPLEVIDTAGAGLGENAEPEGDSRENPGEAAIVVRVVRALVERGLAPPDIGVISPYSAQVGALRRALEEELARGLEIDSVDGFQGREKEVIVFDAVRSNDAGEVGFLADRRRLNVAITRAKRKLYVVGDSATLASDPVWRDYFEDAQLHESYRSIFERPDLT